MPEHLRGLVTDTLWSVRKQSWMIPIFLAGTTGLITIAFLEEVNSGKNVSLILNLLIRKVLDLRSVSIEGR